MYVKFASMMNSVVECGEEFVVFFSLSKRILERYSKAGNWCILTFSLQFALYKCIFVA
jgi:hypothetical protein